VQQLDATIIESWSAAEGCTDGDWLCIAADETASVTDAEMASTTTTAEVVGSAPAQLESGNELIHLDHMYYRMASAPLGDSTASCSEEEVVCEVEVCSEEQPTDDPQLNTDDAILSVNCGLDLSDLADPDLWSDLEQIIIDADQLLGQSDIPALTTPPTAEITYPQIQSSINEEPLKPTKTQNVEILSLKCSETEGLNVSSPLSDSMDTFSLEVWSSQSSRNDFEASSSGIASPFSDELLDGDDYCFHWEESFIELFPTLV